MNSSTSGGAGTMAEKVVAGSVPMATATSSREPFRLPRATCGRPPMGPSGMVTAPPADSAMAATLAVKRIGIGGSGGGVAQRFAVVLGGYLLPLPVHAGGLAVVDLHAVHADVALARCAGRGCARRAG